MIAEEQRDWAEAERWYLKSLNISERQGNEHDAANTYHQLGVIAQAQRDWGTAERWYLKSLAITEKEGNDHGTAMTCGQLGLLATEKGEPLVAGEHWLRTFNLLARLQDRHYAQATLGNFARLLHTASPADAAALWEMGLKALGPEQMQALDQALAAAPPATTASV